MNKKQQKQLLGVGIALAAVLLLLAIVLLYNAWEAKREEDEEEAAKIYVSLSEDAETLAFTDTDGLALSFSKSGDDWVYDADSSFPLDSDTITVLADEVNGLTAEDSFTPEEELSSYGLDAPTYSLTVTDSDGTEKTLLIGGLTSDSSYYYAQVDGEETVYVIGTTIPTRLETTLYDLAETPTIASLTTDNLTSAVISGAAGETTLGVIDVEVTSEDTDSESGDASSGTEPEVTVEQHWTVNGEDVNGDDFMDDLASDLKSINLDGLAAFNPTEDELAAYGISSPVATLTASYTDSDDAAATVTLVIGSADDGNYYCVVNGDTTSVWVLDSDEVSNLLTCAIQGYDQAQADLKAAAEAEETDSDA